MVTTTSSGQIQHWWMGVVALLSLLQTTIRASAFRASTCFLHNCSKNSKRLVTRGMAASATFQDDDASTLLRLIDVDCNLWHKDLPSLLLPTTEQSVDDESFPECFRILHHDDIRDIVAMLSPSSTLTEAAQGIAALNEYSSAACTTTTNRLPTIKTTVGIHPYHVNDKELLLLEGTSVGRSIAERMESARSMLQSNLETCVAAVGECGLDASDGFPSIPDQLPWFQAQIALAVSLRLPLFVHERLAFQQTMDLLNEADNVPILIHCFTGTVAECQAYVERGYFISISGYVFRDDADDVRQCLEQGVIPMDKLMIETDAPYMGFTGCRDAYIAKNAATIQTTLNAKKRKKLIASQYPNAPSSLKAVLAKVLDHINTGRRARGEDWLSDVQLALQTSRNANAFFRFGIDDL
jgi:TatD DNase family protein